jgi:hypothetical protein
VQSLPSVKERRHELIRYVDRTGRVARSATMCPTVLRTDDYRFRKGGSIAKLWLDPVEWEYVEGFTLAEQRRILQVVEQSRDLLLRAYRERHQR